MLKWHPIVVYDLISADVLELGGPEGMGKVKKDGGEKTEGTWILFRLSKSLVWLLSILRV